MGKKHDGQNQRRLTVRIDCVPTPDGEERLSRAMSILLKAAMRNTSQSKDNPANAEKGKPPSQAPAENMLTDGDGECKNGNERNLPD